MKKFLINCSAALLLLASYTHVSAQNTPPTPVPTPPPLIVEDDGEIVIETELVNLNVRVIDRFNRPISNLKLSDFTVLEDRIPQPIKYFDTSEVPTNYTLVIDNSGSLREQLDSVIDASKAIISTNRKDDETSIIRFVGSDNIELQQDFTSNREDLTDALDELYIQGGPTALYDAVFLAADRVNEYEKVRNDVKRRALILVSDGEDRDSTYTEKQLFELLRETNVQIYTIGFVERLDKEGGFIRDSEYKKARKLMTKLAEDTGGKSYFPKSLSELPSIAQDIAKELRTQYSIGYEPTNNRKDGSFRNIRVVVKDGPKKQKRIAITKTGRVATKENNQPQLKKKTQ